MLLMLVHVSTMRPIKRRQLFHTATFLIVYAAAVMENKSPINLHFGWSEIRRVFLATCFIDATMCYYVRLMNR